MAMERASLTWLVFVALSLTSCQLTNVAGFGLPRIFKRQAAAAPAPAPAPAPSPAGAPAAAADKKCEKPLDIVFVLDSSEKIGKDNWEKIINASSTIASKFNLQFARFGVIQYQSYPENSIKLMKFNDDKSLSDTLAKIFYKSGAKRTDLALNATLDVFKAASVRTGSKVVILITGGPSADVFIAPGKSISGEDLLGMPTGDLHKAEVAVYAVGVQEGLSDPEKQTLTKQLGLIASQPTADHVFEVADFAALLTEAPKIANKSCIVNGGWSAWSGWSECRHPCMVKMRTRECNSPAPEFGGLNCTGAKVEQFPCGSAAECQSTPQPGIITPTSPPKQQTVTQQKTTPTSAKPQPQPQSQPQPKPGQPAPPQTTGVVVYGSPDPKNCGNGYEIVTLTDAQFDASTSYAEGPDEATKIQSRIDHMPSMGRVNNTKGRGAWCADHAKALAKDKNQYLQVDLGQALNIGMVETQGQYYYPNAVSKFSINCSVDGVTWFSYGRILDGNTDQNTRVDNHLNPAISVRFIRFIPVESTTDDLCMRVAVYKCRAANLVPPVKDQPEDAWADKWANATRKSKIEKTKQHVEDLKSKSHAKGLLKKKH